MIGIVSYITPLVFLLYVTVIIILIKNITNKPPPTPQPPPPPPPNKVIQGTLNSALFGDKFNNLPIVTNEEFLDAKIIQNNNGGTINLGVNIANLNIYNDVRPLAFIVLSPGKYLISYNLGFTCAAYGAAPSYPLNTSGTGSNRVFWQKNFTLISSKNSENNKCILSENSSQKLDSDSAATFDLYQNSVLYEATEQETIRLNYIAFNANKLSSVTNRDIFWGIQNYEPDFSDQVQKTSLGQGLQKSWFVRALKLS